MAHRAEAGFGFVSILLVLLVLAALYFGYAGPPRTTGGGSVGVSAVDAGRAVACRSNRQSLERGIALWAVDHPHEQPTVRGLEVDGLHIPSCPEGGEYEIAGRRVSCSLHGN